MTQEHNGNYRNSCLLDGTAINLVDSFTGKVLQERIKCTADKRVH